MKARPITTAFWVVGALSLGTSLVPIVSRATIRTLAARSPGASRRRDGLYEKGAGDLLYPPSALLMLLPLGAFTLNWAGRLYFVVDIGRFSRQPQSC